MRFYQRSLANIAFYVWVPSQVQRENRAIFFGHATGIPSLAYRSLLAKLADELGVAVVSYDVPGFGDSAAPAQTFRWQAGYWEVLGDAHLVRWQEGASLLCALTGTQVDKWQWTFVGHSMGAWLSTWAAAKAGLSRVIALDMVWLPFKHAFFWATMAALGARHLHPVGQNSGSRRTRFDGLDTAKEMLQRKALFRGWDEQALVDYIESVFVPVPGGCELNHDPGWEAALFCSQPASMRLSWRRRLSADSRRQLKLLFVAGDRSNACDARRFPALRRMFPAAECLVLPGARHMFPLIERQKTVQIIDKYLAEAF